MGIEVTQVLLDANIATSTTAFPLFSQLRSPSISTNHVRPAPSNISQNTDLYICVLKAFPVCVKFCTWSPWVFLNPFKSTEVPLTWDISRLHADCNAPYLAVVLLLFGCILLVPFQICFIGGAGGTWVGWTLLVPKTIDGGACWSGNPIPSGIGRGGIMTGRAFAALPSLNGFLI